MKQFYMQKIKKKYLVAKFYNRQDQENMSKQGNYYETNDNLSENSLVNSSQCSQKNMFCNNNEQRLRQIGLETENISDFAGLKHFQDYKYRLQRKKKMINASTKPTNLTAHCRSSLSSFKSNSIFLTKQQLMAKLKQHILNKSIQETYQNIIPCQQHFSLNEYNQTNCSNIKSTYHHKHHKSQHFSLQKLKNKMKDYQAGWKKQIDKKKQVDKNNIKFMSVIQSADQYRVLAEKWEKREIQMRQHYQNAWQKGLRKSNIKQKPYITHIQRKYIKGIGQSKLKRQVNWLEDKESKGYFFKKIQMC